MTRCAGRPTDSTNMRIERLAAHHERTSFSCDKSLLDNFLHKLARQYERKNYSRTYVAVKDDGASVMGYSTLSAGAIEFTEIPDEVQRKLPRHPAPVAHLGRLAVDESSQGQGVGALLLADALHRSWQLADAAGIFAVEVRALDDDARAFYLHHGFVPLADDPMHLYLAIATLTKLFGKR